MKFRIPREFMGVSSEEALKLVESTKAPSPIVTPQPLAVSTPATNVNDPENYIILPNSNQGDLLIAMDRTYQGKNWNDAHFALSHDGAYMPTIRQFADFLNLLKIGKAYDGRGKAVDGKRLTSILNDIIKVKDPWRSEWLDAKFGNGTISYHLIENNGSREVTEQLTDYLTENKQISMVDWLKNANEHGLPRAKVKSGSLYHFAPTNGMVARFSADSDWAGLICGGDPTCTDSSLGVRAVRKKI